MNIITTIAQQAQPPQPYIRITTMGEFMLEYHLPVEGQFQRSCYHQADYESISRRGASLTMLKILLCQPQRRITKSRLIEAIWSTHDEINAIHAFDTAASVLRKHILRTSKNASLLYTQRIGKETIFKLPEQAWLWVDADELLAQASLALQAEEHRESPQPYLESALTLAQGEFLEDDWDAPWARARRQTIDGARRRVLHHLADLYIRAQRMRQAEELLFDFLQQYPMDEDALCRLMNLLAQQERCQEALQIYRYTTEVLHEYHREPEQRTKELAHRIRHGLTIRDQKAIYLTAIADPPGQCISSVA
jgi:DNA-binding SARP family transcriptional activator